MRRDKVDIIACILRSTASSQKVSEIYRGSSTSWSECKNYLDFLESSKLVDYNGTNYSVTPKGQEFLVAYDEINKIYSPVIELSVQAPASRK